MVRALRVAVLEQAVDRSSKREKKLTGKLVNCCAADGHDYHACVDAGNLRLAEMAVIAQLMKQAEFGIERVAVEDGYPAALRLHYEKMSLPQ